MDASASAKKGDRDFKEVTGYYIEIEKDFPTPAKQRNTVIKYTKLPGIDIVPKASWSHETYSVQPRLRRIIALEESQSVSSRSLKPDVIAPPKTMSQNSTRRKIVTINEDDEYHLHPRFSRERRPKSVKTTSRSVEADFKDKHMPPKSPTRFVNYNSYSKETKTSAKQPNKNKSGSNIIPKSNGKNRNSKSVLDTTKSKIKEKESPRSNKNVIFSKSKLSNKSFVNASESEITIKAKLNENFKNVSNNKRFPEKPRRNKSPSPTKSKASIMKKLQVNSSPLTVIHVPLENKYLKSKEKNKTDFTTFRSIRDHRHIKENVTNIDKTSFKDIGISTEPYPQTLDQMTEMSDSEKNVFYKCMQSTNVKAEVVKETFDSLHVPNVTLTKDRNESRVEYLHSQSLPNLQTPSFKITPYKNDNSSVVSNYSKSTSFIIGRASLTYTTKQKINFEVVGSKASSNYSNHTPSPLSYPMNVVSVLKNEIKKDLIKTSCEKRGGARKDNKDESENSINKLESLDCPNVSNSNKLMKPSDIISTIRVNNGLSQSDYICEQFQRELNFLDSFFESLQYLESCSLSDTYFNCDKIGNITETSFLDTDLNLKISDYGALVSKLEDGTAASDAETMATKNLFLLNLLIRDEQSRANNLLFVLKRREDALKDFTKSQILYLENKKKNYNQDFSALQKKQRGALLKLQHECGEMQRMRKALLTLSEKRKVALMRTKKDLELKLKNNVDVEQIILGKKKLKRNGSIERASPLKCFDLSSSGCEESTTSRATPETSLPLSLLSPPTQPQPQAVFSAEKSIQTGDSIEFTAPTVDRAAADENFVAVDGSYLNILFQNLSLPQIFSGGKHYEVNKEALKNIVNSTNQQNFKQPDVDKLMNNIRNESDMSSSPSTARSLVEELDQYYRGLREEEEQEAAEVTLSPAMTTIEEKFTKTLSEVSLHTVEVESHAQNSDKIVLNLDRDESTAAGPLPVPPGAPDPQPASLLPIPSTSTSSLFTDSSSYTSQSLCELVSSISSLTVPIQCEAEELRRQQLAIEKEIKELKQQQCRLLVVREIPDKPPPPYTPPVDTKPATPRVFELNDDTIYAVTKYISKEPPSWTDSFDVFLHDFCLETMDRCVGQEQSGKPWDAVNLMPSAPVFDRDKLTAHTTHQLKDILAGPSPIVLSGVSSRRSDHIDDILFAEWRRVEPSWTTLHADEANVKNQIFESIFQKILTQTVDEYKRTVLCDD